MSVYCDQCCVSGSPTDDHGYTPSGGWLCPRCRTPLKNTLSLADLQYFTGTDHLYRHNLVRKVVYTDGVCYLAETGGAYWLIDEIALAQHFNRAVQSEEFQVWTLTVNGDNKTAVLICDDGNNNVVLRKDIPFTDFPLHQIKLYFTNSTICLPSEN